MEKYEFIIGLVGSVVAMLSGIGGLTAYLISRMDKRFEELREDIKELRVDMKAMEKTQAEMAKTLVRLETLIARHDTDLAKVENLRTEVRTEVRSEITKELTAERKFNEVQFKRLEDLIWARFQGVTPETSQSPTQTSRRPIHRGVGAMQPA